jgi:hypothetical protein
MVAMVYFTIPYGYYGFVRQAPKAHPSEQTIRFDACNTVFHLEKQSPKVALTPDHWYPHG